ncbi:phage holin family protein [Gottfriedia luciferensis]|uniref:phage holin family protein n=1 Tax=Gottfriedia luciferensis TaxID=178774 RepID=UPI000B441C4C|nr:phage holin family protein [Gottfriedia luciferensis]
MRWLFSLAINSLVFIVVAGFLQPDFYVANVPTAIIAALVLSILNTIIRPILILITLPVTIFTMGLFLFIINAFTLEITDFLLGDALRVNGFGTALIASILISTFSMLIQYFVFDPKNKKKQNHR